MPTTASSTFRIDLELRQQYPVLAITSRLLDVTDAPAIEQLFADTRPEIVFHAAAYKHVPLLEEPIRPAVRNNIFGTRQVALAADRWDCDRFVLISTDKAVNPANIMGATKRVAELLCRDLAARSTTRYLAVRFGNVLDSAGSVVPLFRRQIEQGGPVTVTHPEIRRFFMTIPEACQLIMQAAALGEGGEIFVLDMGEPVKIRYLAEQMILLSGRQPETEIAIEYIGLRPGEKLYEELFYRDEDLLQTGHAQIQVARGQPEIDGETLVRHLEALAQGVASGDEARLHASLNQLVPLS